MLQTVAAPVDEAHHSGNARANCRDERRVARERPCRQSRSPGPVSASQGVGNAGQDCAEADDDPVDVGWCAVPSSEGCGRGSALSPRSHARAKEWAAPDRSPPSSGFVDPVAPDLRRGPEPLERRATGRTMPGRSRASSRTSRERRTTRTDFAIDSARTDPNEASARSRNSRGRVPDVAAWSVKTKSRAVTENAVAPARIRADPESHGESSRLRGRSTLESRAAAGVWSRARGRMRLQDLLQEAMRRRTTSSR